MFNLSVVSKWGLPVAVVGLFALLIWSGISCTDQQLGQIDQVAEGVPGAVAIGNDVVSDPVIGPLIPVKVGGLISLIGNVLLAISSLWLKHRKDQSTVVLKSVVKAVENAELEAEDDRTAIKGTVAENLKGSGIYLAGKKLIDEVKASS